MKNNPHSTGAQPKTVAPPSPPHPSSKLDWGNPAFSNSALILINEMVPHHKAAYAIGVAHSLCITHRLEPDRALFEAVIKCASYEGLGAAIRFADEWVADALAVRAQATSPESETPEKSGKV